MDRKKVAVKSSIIGLLSKMIAAVLAFVCRKYFLQYLGTDLLGVSSTLTQVLETLALGELGFQTTIIYQLYKPLAEDNHEKASQILMLLKKIYNLLGIVILIVGLCLIPFLDNIITKVDINFSLIYTVYIIMLVGTASSYFLSYNRAILQADQKIYINNIIDTIFQASTSLAKLVSLIVFHNFVLYAVLGVISTVGSNFVSYLYYKKHYSWINEKAKAEKSIIKSLVNNTKDVFIGKIAGYVYNSTDNLVISALVGTAWVGLVGNYSTITNAVKLIIFGITGPIQPMLGNFLVTEDRTDAEKTLMNYGFVRFAMAVFLLIPTLCLSSFFVNIFYGEKYVLNQIIVSLLVADLFVLCLQGAVGEMIDALGYFKREKWLYIWFAAINLILSCIGAKLWGIIPVYTATVISQIMAWIWRSVIAYKYYFKSRKSLLKYWKEQLLYILFFVGVTIITYIIGMYLPFPINFLGFIIYGIIIEIVAGIIFVLCFRRKQELLYIKVLVKKIFPGGQK